MSELKIDNIKISSEFRPEKGKYLIIGFVSVNGEEYQSHSYCKNEKDKDICEHEIITALMNRAEFEAKKFVLKSLGYTRKENKS